MNWSLSVSERYERPHSQRLIYEGRTDRRVSDRRETAIAVTLLAEKASHKVSGNGIGYRLLVDFYSGEKKWPAFSPPEQRIIERVAADFARRLREAGFIERKVRLS